MTSLHCSLVMGVEAAPLIKAMRFFSLATFITPSATDVVTSSVAVSTPSRSNHSRALFDAMSALFWWSAVSISTLNDGFSLAMKSSIAICVASTAPLPARSA